MASGRSPKNRGRGKDPKHGGKEEEEEEPGRNWKRNGWLLGLKFKDSKKEEGRQEIWKSKCKEWETIFFMIFDFVISVY